MIIKNISSSNSKTILMRSHLDKTCNNCVNTVLEFSWIFNWWNWRNFYLQGAILTRQITWQEWSQRVSQVWYSKRNFLEEFFKTKSVPIPYSQFKLKFEEKMETDQKRKSGRTQKSQFPRYLKYRKLNHA